MASPPEFPPFPKSPMPSPAPSPSSAPEASWADDDGGATGSISLLPELANISVADEPDAKPRTEGLDETPGAKIVVTLSDPSMPYQPAKTFEEVGLKDELLKGVYAMSFNKPSAIQEKSLPLIISPDGTFKNLIAQGQTGSGKTACFVLSMLNRVDENVTETQALCLVPTRELARQIESVVKSIGRFTKTTCHLAIPLSDSERTAMRAAGGGRSRSVNAHIVIGTPGSVTESMKRRNINANTIKIFVLDEADHMVSQQGMGDKTVRIAKQLSPNVQTLLFSATYADDVRELAKRVAPNANTLAYAKEKVSIDNVKQYFIDAKSKDGRYGIVNDIYDLLQLGQTIVFMQTRREAQALTAQLREGGQTVSVLTGGEMSAGERDKVIDEFRAGTTRVLVTTNVLSRGVDVPAVTAVINYDLPVDAQQRDVDFETYIHRCGRAGRFGRKGVAINLVYDGRTRAMIGELGKYYGKTIEEVEDVEALEARLKEV